MADATKEPVAPSLPPPRFDRDEFVERGFYVIVEFQDEKRRRDRAAAVKAARAHDDYVCLMTPDNRLLHRCVFYRRHLPRLRELCSLISTWATPRFYVMGYPISAEDLMRGLECYEKMGQTCNPAIDDETPIGVYLGCPRASVSLKYMHPKSWYSLLYAHDPQDARRYVRIRAAGCDDDAGDASANDGPHDATSAPRCPIAELERVSREYCGCPLVHVRGLRHALDALPDVIPVGNGTWRIAPDMMQQPSLQPVSKEAYYELLAELGLAALPSSQHPDVGGEDKDAPEADEDVDAAEERRRLLKRITWLDD